MRNKLAQEYENRRIELIRRLELCKENKKKIIDFVNKVNKDYDHRLITGSDYNKKLDSFLDGKTIEEWIKYYDNSICCFNKELENNELNSEVNTKLKSVIAIVLIMLIIGTGIFYLNPSITGLSVLNEPTASSMKGYEIEGTKWFEIKGSGLYESCLKVNSDIEFNEVSINAKITNARDTKDLTLAIYNNNNETDEPAQKINECVVKDYSDIWKSCETRLEKQKEGDYWICAYSPSGEKETTYFTIAYNDGEQNKRAFWTGKYWQKLESASYTIKVDFRRW